MSAGPRFLQRSAAWWLIAVSVSACGRSCADPGGAGSPAATVASTPDGGPTAPPPSASAPAPANDWRNVPEPGPDDGGALLGHLQRPARRDGGAPLRRKPKRKAGAPRPGWPLVDGCRYEACTTGQGEPGFRYTSETSFSGKPCEPKGVCFNPCPEGMASLLASVPWRRSCDFLCAADEDCAAGECNEGLCDTWLAEPPAKVEGETCQLKDGRQGTYDEATKLCNPTCKLGLAPYGGTDCMKPCKKDADCPGATCIAEHPGEGYCGNPCPELGCPYPWE